MTKDRNLSGEGAGGVGEVVFLVQDDACAVLGGAVGGAEGRHDPQAVLRADGGRPVAADGRGAASAAAGTDTASAPARVSAAVSTRLAPDRQGGRGSALAMSPPYGAFCMLPPVGNREQLRSVISWLRRDDLGQNCPGQSATREVAITVSDSQLASLAASRTAACSPGR